MSHLHIPDGVISPVWLVLGFIGMAALLTLAIVRAGSEGVRSKVYHVGIVSAIMLLAMSVPLGFLPVHLNLAVLAGIFLGPWLGVIAVFVVNLILALFGHGGITVLGLNTLVVGSEVMLGYYLFSALRQRVRLALAAATATTLALVFSLLLMVGIVGLTRIDPVLVLNDHHHGREEYHQVVQTMHLETAGKIQEDEEEGHSLKELYHEQQISLARFVLIVLPIGMVGIVLETVVTTLVVDYVFKVRPDLIS